MLPGLKSNLGVRSALLQLALESRNVTNTFQINTLLIHYSGQIAYLHFRSLNNRIFTNDRERSR